MKHALLVLLCLFPFPLLAQDAVPAGTVLPVQFDTGLNARKLHADEMVRARIMQDVPGTRIRRGAHVVGHVVSATPEQIEIHFDAVSAHGQRIPITASLRALGSMLEVEEAQIPESAPARGMTPEDWNTRQIGGDMVYRGGGPLARGMDVVGEPTPYGALGRLSANPPCRASVDGNDQRQALWLFSTDACGLYGYSGVDLQHAGRTAPVGTIRIAAPAGKLNIRSGSGLLLRVLGS
ncbi:MAG: hypothetical protein WBW84_07185 [Acidobacteriaceae bacterium]